MVLQRIPGHQDVLQPRVDEFRRVAAATAHSPAPRKQGVIWPVCRGCRSAGAGLMRCQGVRGLSFPCGQNSLSGSQRSVAQLVASSRRRPRRLAAHVQCAPVQLPCRAKRLALADSAGCWGRGCAKGVRAGPTLPAALVRRLWACRGPVALQASSAWRHTSAAD